MTAADLSRLDAALAVRASVQVVTRTRVADRRNMLDHIVALLGPAA